MAYDEENDQGPAPWWAHILRIFSRRVRKKWFHV